MSNSYEKCKDSEFYGYSKVSHPYLAELTNVNMENPFTPENCHYTIVIRYRIFTSTVHLSSMFTNYLAKKYTKQGSCRLNFNGVAF